MPHRTADRKLVKISNNTWAALGFLQLIGACLILLFKETKGIATGTGTIDVIIFFGQLVQYKVHSSREDNPEEEADDTPEE